MLSTFQKLQLISGLAGMQYILFMFRKTLFMFRN